MPVVTAWLLTRFAAVAHVGGVPAIAARVAACAVVTVARLPSVRAPAAAALNTRRRVTCGMRFPSLTDFLLPCCLIRSGLDIQMLLVRARLR